MTKRPSKRRAPKQRRSQATVEAILKAAEKVFTDSDVDRASTREIAKRAGVGIGSIYEYYANKDALVRALVERFAEEISIEVNAVFDARVDEPLEVVLPRLVRAVIEVYDRNSPLHARLVRIIPFIAGENPLDAIEGPVRERFAALLTSCADVNTIDVDKVALITVHATRRLIEAASADDLVAIDLKGVETELVTLVLSYLRGSTRAKP